MTPNPSTEGDYMPGSGQFSEGSPFTPQTPPYAPGSPAYAPGSPAYAPATPPDYVPTSPVYNPNSPEYAPAASSESILEVESEKKTDDPNVSASEGEKKTVSFELKPGVADSSSESQTKTIKL